jgi:hypothetical protein
MTSASKRVFENSIQALLRLDAEMAEESIEKTAEVIESEEKLGGEVASAKAGASQLATLKLILESIRRVAEYGADISEVAIDLTVREPRPA